MPTIYFFVYYGGTRFIVGFPDGFEVRGTPAAGVTIDVWNGSKQSKQADSAYGMTWFRVPTGKIYWKVPGYSGVLNVVKTTYFVAIDLRNGSTHVYPPPVYDLTLASDKSDYYETENIKLSGMLRVDGVSIPEVLVTLYRNGVPYLETTTRGNGSYVFNDTVTVSGSVKYYTEHRKAGLILHSDSIIVRRLA